MDIIEYFDPLYDEYIRHELLTQMIPAMKYTSQYDEKEFFVHTLQTVSLAGITDILVQLIIDTNPYNGRHTVEYCLLALIYLSPVLYLWNKYLTNAFGEHSSAAIPKMIFDQFIFAPLALPIHLMLTEVIHGKSFEEAINFSISNFLLVLLPNYAVWPMVQLFNFYVIPTQEQILFTQVVGAVWSITIALATRGTFHAKV